MDLYVLQRGKDCWVARHGGWPTCTELDVTAVLRVHPTASRIGLMGLAGNADIAMMLYRHKESGRLDSVQLVSPLCCPTAAQRRKPADALYYMQQYFCPPSLGGYREMTRLDAVAFSLARASQGGPADADTLFETIRRHPVSGGLDFIPVQSWEAVGDVLGAILDPRWFIDPAQPDRSAKLESWMGLLPPTQDAVLSGDTRGRHWARCRALLSIWFPPEEVREEVCSRREAAGQPLLPVADSPLPGLRPCDFVLRAWANRLVAYPHEDPYRAAVYAALRGSQLLLQFIRFIWLEAIYTGSTAVPDRGASLFSPEMFFRHEAESLAYRAFRQNQRGSSREEG